MKTKQLYLTLIALFVINTIHVQSQSLFDTSVSTEAIDFTSLSTSTIDLSTYEINLEDYKLDYTVEDAPKSITESEAQEKVINYALSMVAFGVGLGINSDQTLWCLHAEYYMRLAMLKKGAVYGALGAAYNGSNSDFLTTTLLDVTLKLLMFTQLVKQFQQVRFLYGFRGAYGFGKEKFEDGFTYDITRLSMGLILGFQIMLAQQWSIMLQTNVFNYQELTRKYQDFETTNYSRWALINKSNILAFSLVYTFANSRR